LSINEAEQHIVEIVKRHTEAKQIIIFAPSLPWETSMFQRPQQLARFLARNSALVFYMQPGRSWPPVFNEVEERLFVCQTPSDVFHLLPNAFVYTVTWNIPLLAYFQSPRVIYDYLDDISTFQGEQTRLQRDHGDYLIKADLVLTTSQKLYQEAIKLRNDCILCENGADVEHFAKAEQPSIVPDDLKKLVANGKPIIGYHGALAHWFDYELLKEVARRCDDVEFVLIGIDHDQSVEQSGILEQPNIHWLGSKPYKELPKFIAYFKAGIIPFKINEITNATSPIKLFEYMAAGKPVIASPMAEASRYPSVLIADTPEKWARKIDEALEKSTDMQFINAFKELAWENSWDARASLIMESLADISSSPRKLPWYWRFQSKNEKIQRLLRLFARGIKVWRMSGWRGFVKGIYHKFYDQINKTRRASIFKRPRALEETYVVEDNSQVVLFTDDESLIPGYWPRQTLQGYQSKPAPQLSLIATVYNEESNVLDWTERILNQTVKPNEIVIVDAGSKDRTLELLRECLQGSAIPIQLISSPGLNIAAGRNLAIQKAQYDLIAVTDFGCRPHHDWLENLVAPFRLSSDTEVVAGWYMAVDKKGRVIPYKGWPVLPEVNPQDFIPSSRSIAFTKEVWAKAGGYPEWLTLTGEDTYLALELKRFASRWGFVPSAVVDWFAPTTWWGLWRKAYTWSIGNGEVGINASLYLTVARQLILGGTALLILLGMLIVASLLLPPDQVWIAYSAVLLLLIALMLISRKFRSRIFSLRLIEETGLRIAQVSGFLKGTSRKERVDRKRLAQTKGLIFMLCGTMIDDSGGGARTTQLAMELLRQGYWIVYVNRYPKWEHQRIAVHIAHPNLFTYALSELYWVDFTAKYEKLMIGKEIHCIIELPTQDFLPLIQNIKKNAGKITYEMIDDWDSSLGGLWYTPSVEQEIIRTSDYLVATAPALQTKMEKASSRTVKLVPNAVNSRLFNPYRQYKRPIDLPHANWIASYIGALWGEWFDWDLLIEVANAYPEAGIVVVGDYRGQCAAPPPNLYFLGLKPQTALPAYLAHTDVAIIPWKDNKITQATSPLKLYEYLAMHRPVVVPKLNPLRDIPGVFRARDFEEFIRLVNEARLEKLSMRDIDDFIADNNWQARVRQLRKWWEDGI